MTPSVTCLPCQVRSDCTSMARCSHANSQLRLGDPRNLSTLRTLKVAKDKYLRNTNKVEPFEIIEMVIVRKKGGVRLTTFRLPGWNVFRNAKDPILGPHFVGLLRGYVDIVTVGAPGAALMS